MINTKFYANWFGCSRGYPFLSLAQSQRFITTIMCKIRYSLLNVFVLSLLDPSWWYWLLLLVFKVFLSW